MPLRLSLTPRTVPRHITTTGWSTLKKKKYFPENVLAVFSIQAMKFCTRLVCALAKTSLEFLFSPDFSSLDIFRKM